MNNDEFEKEYNAVMKRIFFLSEKARREGLLALEALIDENKYIQRDILEYGLRLIVDGTDGQLVNKILTNIVELETDKEKKVLKNIQKEAAIGIQEGYNPRLLLMLLNSYVNIGIEDVMRKYNEI
jgi:flagellar motor component MotA